MKKIVKNNLIYYMNKIGLIKPTSNPFVLMYHRILKNLNNEIIPCQPGMYVTTDTFERHIIYLKNKYNILPLKDLLDNYFSGNEMKRCCSITFDDGWADNYHNAFKILKFYNVPATFFVPTSFIGTNKIFWEEELACFLSFSDKYAIEKTFNYFNIFKNINYLFKDTVSIGDKITGVVRYMKYVDKNLRREMISKITGINSQYVSPSKKIMDWNQICEMHNYGLYKFYPHSHNHELLISMEENEIVEEIHKSLISLSHNIKSNELDIFCYPSGQTNHLVISLLKKFGIKYAFGTKRGVINQKNSKYNLKRIGVHEDISNNVDLFKFCLCI